jgi:hypothetical protein
MKKTGVLTRYWNPKFPVSKPMNNLIIRRLIGQIRIETASNPFGAFVTSTTQLIRGKQIVIIQPAVETDWSSPSTVKPGANGLNMKKPGYVMTTPRKNREFKTKTRFNVRQLLAFVLKRWMNLSFLLFEASKP